MVDPDIRITFGKYKGKSFKVIPFSYLMYLSNKIKDEKSRSKMTLEEKTVTKFVESHQETYNEYKEVVNNNSENMFNHDIKDKSLVDVLLSAYLIQLKS